MSLRPATQFSHQGVIGKKLKKDTNGVPRLSRRLLANGENAKFLSGRCLHAWIDSFPACFLHPSTSLPLSQGLFIMHIIDGVVTTPKLSPSLRHSTTLPGYGAASITRNRVASALPAIVSSV